MLYKLIASSIPIVVLSISSLFGQSAQDYYHNAAKNFIHAKEKISRQILDVGIKKYPNDPSLNALAGLLSDEEKENSQNQQQHNQDGENNEEQNEKRQEEDKKQQEQKQAQEDQEKQQDLQHAQDILDALKKDEKVNQKRQMAKARSKKLEKDW